MEASLRHSEQLQEALLRLEQTVQQEKKLREESDAILEGLSALVGAVSRDEVLLILRTTFKRLIDCFDCWVMQEQDGKLFSSMTDLCFPIGKGFERVLNGGVLNAFDVAQVPEWLGISQGDIHSALHLPLKLSEARGMLIFTSSVPSAFTREAVELVQRIIPFTEQAASKLELIELKHVKELEEAHALLVSLINSVPDLIFYKDNGGVYMGCNTAFCQFAGKQNPNEMIGITDFDMFDKDVAEFFQEKDRAMLAKGGAHRNEEWVTYPDGHKVLLDTLKTPYYNQAGETIGLIGISRDITAYKELEESFLQAQKMESVGTLVGGIAHEFNNTLAAVIGRLFLAKNLPEHNPEMTRHLDKIIDLSDRSAKMIQQLLAFSRKSPVQMKNFDLASFTKDTFKLHKFSISENIDVKTHFSQEPLFIHGDATLLQQILVNLLHNARDAVAEAPSPRIGMVVELLKADAVFSQAHPNHSASAYAHLMVKDNGYGISEDDKLHIFDPFFTTKEVGKGTGLGLAMAYGAIQTHQGFIDVESTLGEGTEMHVYIPITASPSLHKQTLKRQVVQGKGECILLVDDELDVRETGREVLEILGYTVLEASNGLEAVDMYIAHKDTIAITILDVVMPKMGGEEAAIVIQTHNKDANIIFCTGYDKTDVLDDKVLNGHLLITKPYSIETLSLAINSYLAD